MTGRVLINLYPEAWRRRYGAELLALLEEDPQGLRGNLDLLRGALVAHLHPVTGLSPEERTRNTILGCLAAFICFCFAGAGFAKATEDPEFTNAANGHRLISIAHDTVLITALVAAALVLLAAAPLAWRAIAAARQSTDRHLRTLVLRPPLAIAAFFASIAVLSLWLHHHRAHPGVIGWALFTICAAITVTAAAVCWSAPRAIMQRLDWTPDTLRPSTVAMGAVGVCMLVISIATGTYLVALLTQAPSVAASTNGPLGILSTTAVVGSELVPMLVLAVLALITATRGLRAMKSVH